MTPSTPSARHAHRARYYEALAHAFADQERWARSMEKVLFIERQGAADADERLGIEERRCQWLAEAARLHALSEQYWPWIEDEYEAEPGAATVALPMTVSLPVPHQGMAHG